MPSDRPIRPLPQRTVIPRARTQARREQKYLSEAEGAGMVAPYPSRAALARSLLWFAWFQPRSKVDADGAVFFTPYPVCAATGKTARAAPKLIATTKILVTLISRHKPKLQVLVSRDVRQWCARIRTLFEVTALGCVSSGEFQLMSACRKMFGRFSGRQVRSIAPRRPPSAVRASTQLSKPVEKPPSGPQWLHEHSLRCSSNLSVFLTSDRVRFNRTRCGPRGRIASKFAITIHQSNLTKSLKIS